MRAYDQGAYVRVTVAAREVDAFRATWPCSELPRRGVSFTFNRGGDLVDLAPSIDGVDVAALSQDAWQYAVKRLQLVQS